MGRYNSYGWGRYIPVAERRAKAAKKMEGLRKKGMDISPVEIEGRRKIAKTFWGSGWCVHLEKFSDYANRLPRGRAYVRNGSVCHLDITKGSIKAIVSGSELYNVNITVKTLPKDKWREVKDKCAGQIGSLLELLQGKLSENIMAVVTDKNRGMFPLPAEIKLKCDCPDWAVMCKHVAAVLYGVGARLDEKPELIFLLRGVDYEELISIGAENVTAVASGKGSRRRRVAEASISDVFGIDITAETETETELETELETETETETVALKNSVSQKTVKAKIKSNKKGKTLEKKIEKTKKTKITTEQIKKTDNKKAVKITGKAVAKLRSEFNMSQSQFAHLLGVSVPTISNWEKNKGQLKLRERTLSSLTRAMNITVEEARKQ